MWTIQANVILSQFRFHFVNFSFAGPVVKQTVLIEHIPIEVTPSSENSQQEKLPGSPVSSEQRIASATVTEKTEKSDEEQEQTNDEQQKSPYLELKPSSACNFYMKLLFIFQLFIFST